jgi:hypothetical protein
MAHLGVCTSDFKTKPDKTQEKLGAKSNPRELTVAESQVFMGCKWSLENTGKRSRFEGMLIGFFWDFDGMLMWFSVGNEGWNIEGTSTIMMWLRLNTGNSPEESQFHCDSGDSSVGILEMPTTWCWNPGQVSLGTATASGGCSSWKINRHTYSIIVWLYPNLWGWLA